MARRPAENRAGFQEPSQEARASRGCRADAQFVLQQFRRREDQAEYLADGFFCEVVALVGLKSPVQGDSAAVPDDLNAACPRQCLPLLIGVIAEPAL
jgi:hypothetical protein